MSLANVRLLVLDFDGVLTSNDVWTFGDGSEAVRSWRGDGLGIRAVQRLGVSVVVVSTEPSPIVAVRCEKLRVHVDQDVKDKAAAVECLALCAGIELEEVAFLGNDINDIPALGIVGHPWVVADRHPALAKYPMLSTPGGYGAVRELCDMICEAKDAKAYNPYAQWDELARLEALKQEGWMA